MDGVLSVVSPLCVLEWLARMERSEGFSDVIMEGLGQCVQEAHLSWQTYLKENGEERQLDYTDVYQEGKDHSAFEDVLTTERIVSEVAETPFSTKNVCL